MLDLDLWEHSVHSICGNFDTQPHRNIPFIGKMRLDNHNGLGVVHIETNAEKIVRSKSTSQDDKNYFVILQKKGSMGFSWSNNNDLLLPGEIALIDSSLPYDMHPQGLIEQMSVHLPKSYVDHLCSTHAKNRITKIAQNRSSSQMLSAILRQLANTDHQAPSLQEDGDALQCAISALIKPSLEITNNDSASSMKERAKQHILRLLTEESLGPERIAKAMNMSKRSLYRLFSKENISVAQFILQMRIEKCCEDMRTADAMKQPLSITEVAYRWGFSDASQLSRAFKRVKGVSPSQWRQSQF
ncbi:Transcriptional activator FeaR [Marinomonas spartinae]|uniref:Transcriptional activator FeaR n=1 Tax=Marinomonas spartinae TaxID=1792290 RepID=A0A1A8TF87_9GAMM|nr:transcriptional regulator FeaR [Marinomonas spartinae]SBS30536.1 Transcriptional activator FeaR [Marinomonas spartinae]SBS36538.1 Transcriptional activator FeaR [Marinomonas spartinae]